MRYAVPLLLLIPSVSFAQTKGMIDDIQRKLDRQRTAKWVLEQEASNGGFYNAPQDPKVDAAPRASLRATNGAVRALKYLGFPLLKSEKEKHAKFVLSCYDPRTGGFAEPGGKPDVVTTSIGIMVAAELDIPHEKYARAMDYLKEHARTFEEVRIAAAAVEAWGVKECPFKLDEWFKVAGKHIDSLNLEGSAEQIARWRSARGWILHRFGVAASPPATQQRRPAGFGDSGMASATTAAGARRARRRPISKRPIA